MDSSGRVVVVFAPRGDLVTAWDVGRREFVGAINLADGCGVAAAGVPGTFGATSGRGGIGQTISRFQREFTGKLAEYGPSSKKSEARELGFTGSSQRIPRVDDLGIRELEQ